VPSIVPDQVPSEVQEQQAPARAQQAPARAQQAPARAQRGPNAQRDPDEAQSLTLQTIDPLLDRHEQITLSFVLARRRAEA
jgi:hypothetical protein